MSEVETRYLVVSGPRFAPPAPDMIIEGETTPANMANALWYEISNSAGETTE